MRVLIADDHDLVREVIAAFLVSKGVCEVEAVASLDLALEAVRQGGAYDLVLLDYNMPGMNGLEGMEIIALANGGKPVALISGTASPALAEEAITAGAAGFLSKDLGSKAMAEAVRLMLAGQIYAPTAFPKQGRDRIHPALSPRETDVLKGICAGKSNKEIARDHDLQEVTVKLHVKTMRHKLGARNRTHAATIAKEQGLA